MGKHPIAIHITGALLVMAVAAGDANAQAWVSPQGVLDASLDYNLGISDKLIYSEGAEGQDAGTTTHQLALAAEYVPIPRLAVSASLPFVALKFTGNEAAYPHEGGGAYDDGTLHMTLTDLRVGARYQVLDGVVALSPHVALSIPVADYETVGNAVPGRHLKALHLGFGVGKVFFDALYVHLLYEFSLVEKYDRTPVTAQYGQNRHDIALSIGYKLLDGRLDLNVGTNIRQTTDGIDVINFSSLAMDEQLYHDAILDEDIVLAGGGLGYQLTDTVSASLAARFFVSGRNTQAANVFGLGLQWSPL